MNTIGITGFLGALVAAAGMVGCATDTRPPGFDDAAYTARLKYRDPRNARFNAQMERDFLGRIRKILRKCRLESLDTSEATLLFRLDSSGTTTESMIYPVNTFSECVFEGVSGFDFPPPPDPDYWLGFFIPRCPLGGGLSECSQLAP